VLRHALCILLLLLVKPASADEVIVAVASSFKAPMQALTPLFEQQTGHRVLASFGSSGKLASQVGRGAPFEVFLSADEATPAGLERDGAAVAGTRFTYAVGRLVLWSRDPGLVDADGAVLHGDRFDRLAIADPRLAPYGAAATQTLRRLGLLERLQPRLVIGENITQAHQFVATGNAQLGFVARSQLQPQAGVQSARGSVWLVPPHLHAPIHQQAVLLAHGRNSPAAHALLKFLRSGSARRLIRHHGFDLVAP
jgi:molybdate transport system substrate-binding protein